VFATVVGAEMPPRLAATPPLMHAAQSYRHAVCTFCRPRSRPDHGPTNPCTECGQLCGQPRTFRGLNDRPVNRPQPRRCVPTALHQLSTSVTRCPACADRGRSTLSTGLTTAVAVSSSRTLLVNNGGDEQLVRWFAQTTTTTGQDRPQPPHGRCSGPGNTDPG
jgi:hypothetical protein